MPLAFSFVFFYSASFLYWYASCLSLLICLRSRLLGSPPVTAWDHLRAYLTPLSPFLRFLGTSSEQVSGISGRCPIKLLIGERGELFTGRKVSKSFCALFD